MLRQAGRGLWRAGFGKQGISSSSVVLQEATETSKAVRETETLGLRAKSTPPWKQTAGFGHLLLPHR
jgi:hypothetical protein